MFKVRFYNNDSDSPCYETKSFVFQREALAFYLSLNRDMLPIYLGKRNV